jgi:hypothetical protein
VLLTQAVDRSVTAAADRQAPQVGSSAPRGGDLPDGSGRKLLHERALRDHASEAPRGEWSEATSRSLRSDLEEIEPEGQFHVVSVDCRSVTCTATLEWPTYDLALKTWPLVLNQPFQTNCGVEIFLAQPEGKSTEYRSTVLFRCQQEDQHS